MTDSLEEIRELHALSMPDSLYSEHVGILLAHIDALLADKGVRQIDPRKTVTLDIYSGGGAYAVSIGNKDGGTRITPTKASPGTTVRSYTVNVEDILDALRDYAGVDSSLPQRTP